jgi:hypothetical protein
MLYKFLRYNRLAIDFWLATFVFPEETKVFPGNLKATAWHVADGTVRFPPLWYCQGDTEPNGLHHHFQLFMQPHATFSILVVVTVPWVQTCAARS